MTVKAPNFKLISTSDEVVELNKIKSKLVVLYFYPKDDTPGCTLETKDFNNLISKFSKNNCSVYGFNWIYIKISFFAKSKEAGIIFVFNSLAILKKPVFHSLTFERVPSGDIAIKEPSIFFI